MIWGGLLRLALIVVALLFRFSFCLYGVDTFEKDVGTSGVSDLFSNLQNGTLSELPEMKSNCSEAVNVMDCIAGLKELDQHAISQDRAYFKNFYEPQVKESSNKETFINMLDVISKRNLAEKINSENNYDNSNNITSSFTDELYRLNNSYDMNIGDNRYHIMLKNYSSLLTDKVSTLGNSNKYRFTFDLGFTNAQALNIKNDSNNYNYSDIYTKADSLPMKNYSLEDLNQNQYLPHMNSHLLKKSESSSLTNDFHVNTLSPNRTFGDIEGIVSASPDLNISNVSNNTISPIRTLSDEVQSNKNTSTSLNPGVKVLNGINSISSNDSYSNLSSNSIPGENKPASVAEAKMLETMPVSQVKSNVSSDCAGKQATFLLQRLNTDSALKNTTHFCNQTRLYTVSIDRRTKPILPVTSLFQDRLQTPDHQNYTDLLFPFQYPATKSFTDKLSSNAFVNDLSVSPNFSTSIENMIVSKERKFLMKYDIDSNLKKYTNKDLVNSATAIPRGLIHNSIESYLTKHQQSYKGLPNVTSQSSNPMNISPTQQYSTFARFQPVILHPKSVTYIPSPFGTINSSQPILTTNKNYTTYNTNCSNATLSQPFQHPAEFAPHRNTMTQFTSSVQNVSGTMSFLKSPMLNTSEKLTEDDRFNRRVYHSYYDLEKPESRFSKFLFVTPDEYRQSSEIVSNVSGTSRNVTDRNEPLKSNTTVVSVDGKAGANYRNLEHSTSAASRVNTFNYNVLHTTSPIALSFPSFHPTKTTNTFKDSHTNVYKGVSFNETESKKLHSNLSNSNILYYKEIKHRLATITDPNKFNFDMMENRKSDFERRKNCTIDSNGMQYAEIDLKDTNAKIQMQNTSDNSFMDQLKSDHSKPLNIVNFMDHSRQITAAEINPYTITKNFFFHAKYKSDFQSSTVIYFAKEFLPNDDNQKKNSSASEHRMIYHAYKTDEEGFRETHPKLFRHDHDDNDTVYTNYSNSEYNYGNEDLHSSLKFNITHSPQWHFEYINKSTISTSHIFNGNNHIVNHTVSIHFNNRIFENRTGLNATTNHGFKFPAASDLNTSRKFPAVNMLNTSSSVSYLWDSQQSYPVYNSKLTPNFPAEDHVNSKFSSERTLLSTNSVYNASLFYNHLNSDVKVDAYNVSSLFVPYKNDILNNDNFSHSTAHNLVANPDANKFKENFDLVRSTAENLNKHFGSGTAVTSFVVKENDINSQINNEPSTQDEVKFKNDRLQTSKPVAESRNQFILYQTNPEWHNYTTNTLNVLNILPKFTQNITPIAIDAHYRARYNNSGTSNGSVPESANLLTKSPNMGIMHSVLFNNPLSLSQSMHIKENDTRSAHESLNKNISNILNNYSSMHMTTVLHDYGFHNPKHQPLSTLPSYKGPVALPSNNATLNLKAHDKTVINNKAHNKDLNIFLKNNPMPLHAMNHVSEVAHDKVHTITEGVKNLIQDDFTIKPLNLSGSQYGNPLSNIKTTTDDYSSATPYNFFLNRPHGPTVVIGNSSRIPIYQNTTDRYMPVDSVKNYNSDTEEIYKPFHLKNATSSKMFFIKIPLLASSPLTEKYAIRANYNGTQY